MTKAKNITNNVNANTKYFTELAGWSTSVFNQTVRMLKSKCDLTTEKAEDFAAMGLEYALKPGITGTGSYPKSEEDLLRLTLFTAKNRVKDSYRRERRNPVKASIDDDMGFEDDKPAESKLVRDASYNNWRDAQAEAEYKAFAASIYNQRNDIFDLIKLSDFRREVFSDVYLNAEPVAEVAKRHNIKPNYVYNIVFTTKAALAKLAPMLRQAA